LALVYAVDLASAAECIDDRPATDTGSIPPLGRLVAQRLVRALAVIEGDVIEGEVLGQVITRASNHSPSQRVSRRSRVWEQLNRITQQPDVMGGKACIRGMRVTVGMVVGQIGAGHSVDEVLADYPYLEREDIMQALRYAAWRSRVRSFWSVHEADHRYW
jgi:uncharacterized protein (DUF433 family)